MLVKIYLTSFIIWVKLYLIDLSVCLSIYLYIHTYAMFLSVDKENQNQKKQCCIIFGKIIKRLKFSL